MTAKHSTKLSLKARVIIVLAIIAVIALGITAFSYYLKYFGPNVSNKEEYLYIKTGSDFETVYRTIRDKEIVNDSVAFRQTAETMNYPQMVKPGKYRLKGGMSNRKFIAMLRSGDQEPVQLKFKNHRLKENMAAYIATQIEADSSSIVSLLDSTEFVEKYGFNTDNVYSVFIPNSYEIYWNTSAKQFFDRMYKEYQKFWTPSRIAKAEKIGLSKTEVSTLAAIVDAEALNDSEMPTIAGLYMNRYKAGIKLQADPTVIFANKDFTIRRVLNRHLTKDSPYNTYVYKGLPPGPIMMPSINAIDAVLNHEKHKYIFMCAKEDFSGYHNFAVTQAEHQANARRFQRALNERNIKK
ncbi:endolytic transglycosylase MltG [Paradesertivirga mongoliensis]|uniref:Endolytic murein transglycosylase n=1 Tax=Paradesertivirga mongoliensis TaxID=2100740 RepID=A0ABW4ZR43_9SPHI|nr:endolytic transglycosylase MltG [Pedobacter mongoliensis]